MKSEERVKKNAFLLDIVKMEELLETQLQEDRTTTTTGRHYLCGGGRAGRRAGLDAVKADECGLARPLPGNTRGLGSNALLQQRRRMN